MKSNGVLNARAERIVAFCAASVPSTSMVGSDSANPSSCASSKASSKDDLSSDILESIKLVVPLRIPANHLTLLATRPSLKAFITGVPPATEASNPIWTP